VSVNRVIGYNEALDDVRLFVVEEANRVHGQNGGRPERADGKPSKQLRFLWRMCELLDELEWKT
jgi:hypothetical protein